MPVAYTIPFMLFVTTVSNEEKQISSVLLVKLLPKVIRALSKLRQWLKDTLSWHLWIVAERGAKAAGRHILPVCEKLWWWKRTIDGWSFFKRPGTLQPTYFGHLWWAASLTFKPVEAAPHHCCVRPFPHPTLRTARCGRRGWRLQVNLFKLVKICHCVRAYSPFTVRSTLAERK